MISRVLVPMDESEMAERALRFALEAHPDAEIIVLHVVGQPSSMMGARPDSLATTPRRRRGSRRATCSSAPTRSPLKSGTEIKTDVMVGHPARAVVNASGEFDTVVIGSHSGSLADRLLVGNIAEKIVRGSAAPVTVVR